MAVPVELPAGVVEAVVHGARRGHDIAARAHLDEEGWDASTFGFVRYRLSWFWIAAELDEIEGVEVIDRASCLRARCGDIEVGFYNGGVGAGWNPHSFEFDATARRAEVGFANMSPLPGMEQPSDLQHLLVVYSASTSRGCLKVYLGAPITSPITAATSWAWIEEIWSAPEGEGDAVDGDAPQWPSFRDLDAVDLAVDLRDDAGEAGSGTDG